MSKIKYYYDTETCEYKRIKASKKEVIISYLGFISLNSLVGLGFFLIADLFFQSPTKLRLKRENQELKIYYDYMKKDLSQINDMVSVLQERDDNVYRTIFGIDPLSKDVREGGIGGADKYEDILDKQLESEGLLLGAMKRIDQLKSKIFIQTQSYDELTNLALNKEELLASLPAIQPVSNKELIRLASGFGFRIDPILKVKRMHFGVDFSINVGTPVYATGNGVIKKSKRSFSGLGNHIEINHGFGYVTRYAHLSKFIVMRGQKVKRGELIGYSGNTGKSTAPHLHYEVIQNDKHVNPINFFFADLSQEEYARILELSSVENQSIDSGL